MTGEPPLRPAMRRRPFLVALAACAAFALAVPATGFAVGDIPEIHKQVLGDVDNRTGTVAPTSERIDRVSQLGARVSWNRFGTPRALSKPGGYLATGIAGDSAVAAARSWIEGNKALFRLSSTDGLVLYRDSSLAQSNGHAVHFRQTFGGLTAGHDGLITVGLTGTPQSGWSIAYVSSSLTGDTALSGAATLSAQEAWLKGATSVGRGVSVVLIDNAKDERGWTVFGVPGFSELQRARLVAVPTPVDGVRPAFEVLVVDNQHGSLSGYKALVDAANGSVLVRENLVHQTHPTAATFAGTVPVIDGACDVDMIPTGWTITGAEAGTVASVDVVVEATITANDSVIHLVRDGNIVASADTATSPEAIHYAPSGGAPTGTYKVRVCDFADAAPWTAPSTYNGTIAFNGVAPSTAIYPPKWNVFPAYPTPPALGGYPWNVSNTDIRKLWCWDSVVQGTPVAGCQDEVGNLAARIPWDTINPGPVSTFRTVGNAADSAESWTNPLAPGASGHRPQDLNRNYNFPWTNVWYTSGCFTPFVVGMSHDVSAATANLFAMHNRMHDWSYFLGFTEENWNAQRSNFGLSGMENDPVEGESQAGALDGGYPAYLGRDNANMLTLPDGVPSITNMYLWQPLRASFYAPCVDGDYDMSVIGHEYGHMIENRLIGKGNTRSGHHAGAMGESSGDLLGMEVVNEFGFVPVSDENRYSVGAFATGNKQRGIRNYGMNQSPLNFSNMGYDAFSADPVHANGEIWSATNFEIRQLLNTKYNASYPSSDNTLQRKCADGLGNPVTAPNAPEACPGNRRWIQTMFDAYLLMPVAPSMLDARDAYLAADLMRFSAANQNQSELWLAFAHRGFGQAATSTNGNVNSDTDPTPDFGSPLHSNATATFGTTALNAGNTAIATAKIYVGHYEARTSPIADTNPGTSGPNLDNVAQFAPGTYEFLVQAPGYGAVKFTRSFAAGENAAVNIGMPSNWASSTQGATASGDGTSPGNLINDTESTLWESTVAPVANKQVTVDLSGTLARNVIGVQVSASLNAGHNRFTALRQFRIDTSLNGIIFTPAYTSPADAFPGVSPRPTLPDIILRSFTLPSPTLATHVRLVVLTNQCTGQTDFHGVQDNDLLNPTDCRGQGEPVGTDPAGQSPPAQAATVRAAELQVFTSQPTISNGPTAVRVLSLTARRTGPGVVVRWRTASEVGIAGFNVWRAGTKVNRALIPAKRVSGATYRLVDRTARPGVTYTYRLQAVSRDGSRMWFGEATARGKR